MLGLVCGGLGALLFLALLEGGLCDCAEHLGAGAQGITPPAKTTNGGLGVNSLLGVLRGIEVLLGRGLGLCKASKERVPRKGWKLKAGKER